MQLTSLCKMATRVSRRPCITNLAMVMQELQLPPAHPGGPRLVNRISHHPQDQAFTKH